MEPVTDDKKSTRLLWPRMTEPITDDKESAASARMQRIDASLLVAVVCLIFIIAVFIILYMTRSSSCGDDCNIRSTVDNIDYQSRYCDGDCYCIDRNTGKSVQLW
jgi:hypothetical protein